MSEAALDPYAVLGVTHDVSDIELRRVYRGLVKRYHPDHNGGSAESAARFAQIQTAYTQIAQHRTPPQPGQPASAPQQPAGDPDIEDRIAGLERELAAMRQAQQQRHAQEQARLAREQQQRAREQVRHAVDDLKAAGSGQAQPRKPTPEELGYYTTDDSFTKIIDDAAEQLGERLAKSDAKRQFTRRLSDLFGRDS